MNVLQEIEAFVPQLSLDHALIVKKRGCREWVAHGDPIDIHTRWSHGKVIDARCTGAKVCTDDVIVLFRPCSSEVFVIDAQNVKGSLYAYLRNGRYSDDKRIKCEGSAGE